MKVTPVESIVPPPMLLILLGRVHFLQQPEWTDI